VHFEFLIRQWAAYAGALTDPADWLDWASRPVAFPPQNADTVPPLSEMPAMMRRRIDRLGRMACQVAYWCHEPREDVPVVFASRYGDAARSLALLGDLAQGQPLSPTGFGLSVHNAVAALYSMARGDTANSVVVAAGRATVAAALTEAAGLLADGAPEVLVVYCESPLPADYACFHDEPALDYAWAWRVAAARVESKAKEGVRVALSVGEAGGQPRSVSTDVAQPPMPAGLAVLHQVLNVWQARHGLVADKPASLQRSHDRPGAAWHWSSHVA
jgi:hypothetical protein